MRACPRYIHPSAFPQAEGFFIRRSPKPLKINFNFFFTFFFNQLEGLSEREDAKALLPKKIGLSVFLTSRRESRSIIAPPPLRWMGLALDYQTVPQPPPCRALGLCPRCPCDKSSTVRAIPLLTTAQEKGLTRSAKNPSVVFSPKNNNKGVEGL